MPAVAGDSDRRPTSHTTHSLLIAPQVDGKPVPVRVGIFLTNLIDVDEVKELFHISGYFFMTWKDPRLVFYPRPGATQREYSPDEIWTPSLLMINATARREKITVNIKGDPDGTIHYMELFQVELTTSFLLEPFPFDDQSLEIFLQPFLDERDTVAIAYDEPNSGVGTDPFVELAQWKILGFKANEQRREIGKTGKQIPELEIDLQVKRKSRYYIWKVFLPLAVMVAIAYSAFWIKIGDYYTQISITLTAILTEIAFLFAISSSLPKVPYLTFHRRLLPGQLCLQLRVDARVGRCAPGARVGMAGSCESHPQDFSIDVSADLCCLRCHRRVGFFRMRETR